MYYGHDRITRTDTHSDFREAISKGGDESVISVPCLCLHHQLTSLLPKIAWRFLKKEDEENTTLERNILNAEEELKYIVNVGVTEKYPSGVARPGGRCQNNDIMTVNEKYLNRKYALQYTVAPKYSGSRLDNFISDKQSILFNTQILTNWSLLKINK